MLLPTPSCIIRNLAFYFCFYFQNGHSGTHTVTASATAWHGASPTYRQGPEVLTLTRRGILSRPLSFPSLYPPKASPAK